MNLEKFLEQNNGLVIGTEATSHYQFIHTQTEEVWGTFTAPADLETIETAQGEFGPDLALGQHQFRLVAFGTSGAMRAQCLVKVEGRVPMPKGHGPVAAEHTHHARATRMNVDTAEQQLQSMTARMQVLESRAYDAEERSVTLAREGFEMMKLVNDLVTNRENLRRAEELHQARVQSALTLGASLLPMVQPFVAIGVKWAERKTKEWGQEAEGDDRKAAE